VVWRWEEKERRWGRGEKILYALPRSSEELKGIRFIVSQTVEKDGVPECRGTIKKMKRSWGER